MGGAAGVAVVVALTLAMRVGAAPACAAVPVAAPPLAAPPLAAPPLGDAVHQGKSTFYDSNGGGGNCSNVQAPADRLYVALGPSEYAAAAACGGYLDVTGPKGQVRVLVMDQCPECEPGHLDLSKEAFARIADPVQGIVPVTYRAVVNPPLSGPLTFRMKEGTSQFWFAVLVADHGNPLTSVEARAGGSGWRAAARQTYNYWVIDSGLGSGPYAIRVTDVYGHQVVAEGVRLSPGQTQKSTVRLYGGAATGRVATTSPARSVSPPRSSPSAPADGSLTVGSGTPSSSGIPTPLAVDSLPDRSQIAASCGQ